MSSRSLRIPVSVLQPRTAIVHSQLYGVGLAIVSNLLFGVLYVYSSWLAPLSGTQVFVWRILAMWLVLVSFLLLSGQMQPRLTQIRALLDKNLCSRASLKNLLWLLLPTPILGSQFWLFMWAPVNGQGIQTAMGYFLFPLMMVLFGCVLFGERLSRLQWLAVGLAALGVATEMLRTGSVSWATLWVCGTYPIYYILRRRQGVSALTGLLVDLTLIAPFALVYLLWMQPDTLSMVADSWVLLFMILGLGVISVLAMQTNVDASQLLPVNVFGMLSYVEPALLFVLAVTLLGNPFEQQMLLSYGLIWAGIGCLLLHGVIRMRLNKSAS